MRGTNILALRQRVCDLNAQMRALLDSAKQAGREFSSDEQARWADLNVQRAKAQVAVTEEESRLDGQRQMHHFEDENVIAARRAMGGMSNGQVAHDIPAGVLPVAGKKRTYESIFGPVRGASGFRNMGEFARSVGKSNVLYDPRLQASTATEAVPNDGGFLVPQEYAAQILQTALEDAIVLPRAQVWPMSSSSIKIPGVRDTDHTANLFGGVTAVWAAEAATLNDAAVKTRQIQLSANKLGFLTNASNELIEDSSFETVIQAKLQEACQYFLDVSFFFGDGAGQPLGFLTSSNPALVTVNKESSQPTGEIVYENCTKMFASMHPRSRGRAVWIMNNGLIPSCFKLQSRVLNAAGSDFVGGSAVPVFTMNQDGTGTLLGRPVLFTEKLPAAGTLYDIAFVDLTQYAVGMRREIRLEQSIQPGFTNDTTYYRLTVRLDGQPTWDTKLKIKDGTYVSPYVTLQAR